MPCIHFNSYNHTATGVFVKLEITIMANRQLSDAVCYEQICTISGICYSICINFCSIPKIKCWSKESLKLIFLHVCTINLILKALSIIYLLISPGDLLYKDNTFW